MAVNVYEKAAEYYSKGLWSIAQLEALVGKGKLTQEQVNEIIGVDDNTPPEAPESVVAAEPEQVSTEAGNDAENAPESAEEPLEDMTKAELLSLASERGVEAYDSWTKAEIIAAIEAA